MNPLEKRIGIIGGGQLGKMMVLDAKRLGFEIVTLDPTEDCPSHSISDEHIRASFQDEAAYRALADAVDVITYEFEHIDADLLSALETTGHAVYPTADSLKIIQDKFTQKSHVKAAGILTPAFMKVETMQDMELAGETYGFPYMLKATTGGYDGKGNAVVGGPEEIEMQFAALGAGKVGLMAEKFIDYDREISVLACRGLQGDIVVYPVAENIHSNSILDETLVPARMSAKSRDKAMDMAHEIMEIFEGVGMFCTEMFLDPSGEVYLNEVAPRPHNSGHYTIEATATSQYEQHIRAITGLPLGDVDLIRPVAMKNILGEGPVGPSQVLGVDKAYENPHVKVHVYGKKVSKPGRKMGHITATGETLEEARASVEEAYRLIRIQGGKE